MQYGLKVQSLVIKAVHIFFKFWLKGLKWASKKSAFVVHYTTKANSKQWFPMRVLEIILFSGVESTWSCWHTAITAIKCQVGPSSICKIAAFPTQEVWNIIPAFCVNRERVSSSSWLHPTVHVGSLMGSSCTTEPEVERRVLVQQANHRHHCAQTKSRQLPDNCNQCLQYIQVKDKFD